MRPDFLPFSAVVGQEDAKLALILAACDRRIGGVLLRGDKGTAKSTLARGMAVLLPGDAPFVELPLGATEDRVVGTLDLAAALTGGEKRFEPGLLHAADGGVLYVDEINLLPDHLVDVLLDVAASGVNRIEREGVSHAHESRFVLVGSMNPEEGDLRPQLLDRFGLAVDVRTPVTLDERLAALRRRLAFDADPASVTDAVAGDEADVATRLADWRPSEVPTGIVEAVAAVCAAAGAEGLRADLTICRAAAALAGWEGRPTVTADDVRRVAPLALAHRARRDPLDPSSGPDRSEIEQVLEDSLGAGGRDEDQLVAPGSAIAPPLPISPLAPGAASGRRGPGPGPRGRLVGARRPEGPVTSVAVGATVREAVSRRAADPTATDTERLVEPSDIRQAVRQHRTANLIVIAVDASGSMGAAQRMEAAKGAVIALLRDAYQRRDQVSLVSFRGEGAEVVLRPTGSVEVARARLTDLATGGRTPLAAGLRAALEVAIKGGRAGAYRPLVVLITDARATTADPGEDPFETATTVAVDFRRAGIPSAVIDVEATGPARLGLASRLAAAMGGSYIPIRDLTPAAVEDAVRQAALR